MLAALGEGRALAWLLVAATGGLALVWAAVILLLEQVHFAVVAPEALARLFGALVLFQFPGTPETRERLRWVASGLLALGLGTLVFGYAQPLVAGPPDPSGAVYASVTVWSAAAVLVIAGLVPDRPRRFAPLAAAALLGASVALGAALLLFSAALPPLVPAGSLEMAAATAETSLHGLTGWYWALASLPLALATTALGGGSIVLYMYE